MTITFNDAEHVTEAVESALAQGEEVGEVIVVDDCSTDTTPDVLDEIRWNLDWMITMQDADGGVWPKLTSEKFGSFVMPEKDDGGLRYIIGTGSPPVVMRPPAAQPTPIYLPLQGGA